MSSPATATIAALYRYPVKGLTAERLDRVAVEQGRCIPFDRAWAIEHGARTFDPEHPAYLPKTKFLMLMSHEKLAALETRFDAASSMLTILRDGRQVAAGRLDERIGRQLIEQFFAAFMSDDLRGAPRIVAADGHHFTDVEAQWLSLINLASVRDLARVMHSEIDPLRFRANIYLEGLEPWVESDWVGRDIAVAGQPALTGVEEITRCAATNVDPKSGARDMAIPRALMSAFGHMNMGLYVEVARSAELATGDRLTPA